MRLVHADLDAACEAGAEQTFISIAEENESNPLITEDGCGTAPAMTVCHVHGAGGPCRNDAECEGVDLDIDDSCAAAGSSDDGSCCVKLYRRACDGCAPEAFSCGQFCARAPGANPFDPPEPPEALADTPGEGAPELASADAPGPVAIGPADGPFGSEGALALSPFADAGSGGGADTAGGDPGVVQGTASAAASRGCLGRGVGVACAAAAAFVWVNALA